MAQAQVKFRQPTQKSRALSVCGGTPVLAISRATGEHAVIIKAADEVLVFHADGDIRWSSYEYAKENYSEVVGAPDLDVSFVVPGVPA